jgi:hypothetical protein
MGYDPILLSVSGRVGQLDKFWFNSSALTPAAGASTAKDFLSLAPDRQSLQQMSWRQVVITVK